MARRMTGPIGRYEYIMCRTFGHAWEEWHTDKRPSFGYYEVVHCTRCGMERLFTIDARGEVAGRAYDPPEGYSLAGEEHQPDRAEWRREMRERGFWQETLSPALARHQPRHTKRKAGNKR